MGMYTTCMHCGEFFALDDGIIHKCPDNIPRMTVDETSPHDVELFDEVTTTSDTITEVIVSKYYGRAAVGMKKYGVSLEDNPKGLLFWLRNFQEELMDATVYIERTMQEIRNTLKDD